MRQADRGGCHGGEVRIGAETRPIRAGDLMGCPPGGPETAQQTVNTGEATLRYLAVSGSQTPEFHAYPDAGRPAVMHAGGCDYRDGE